MKRVLVFGMTENPGGVESFLINYYRNIDRNKIQFDFLCNSYELVAYENELLKLGGRTFHITARSKNRTLYKRELNDLFKKHSFEWSAIWVNVCSLANIDYLKVAKKYGIKKRIIHSHNSQNMDNKLRVLLHIWNKRSIEKYATDFWACSEDAAHWFYNDEIINKVVIIHNAIDVDRMKFDENKRNSIRTKYGWNNTFVIGNIGRLHFQKNQSFAIDVISELEDTNILVLIGQGEDEEKLRKKAKALGLEDRIYFLGVQQDIQAWLSSFDLFLFPSVFEGLSVVAMEAQANGIPIVASKGVIPDEVVVNDNFVTMDLAAGEKAWAEKIETMSFWRIPSEIAREKLRQKGFEVGLEIEKLYELL